MITEPGFHAATAAAYHADPCPAPSLSATIARRLLKQSPLHAWHHHPRLNPVGTDDDTNDAATAGTILHALLLGKGSDLAVIDAPDFRTAAARQAKQAAFAAGKTPVLAGKLDQLHACAVAARRQIEQHPDGALLFEPGVSEQAMVWQEAPGIWCRALVDRTPADSNLPLLDLKTTGLSAAPADWERRILTEYYLQAAFYERGARILGRPNKHPMLFVVVEQAAPFGVSVMACDPSLRALAEAEIDRAIRIWTDCLRQNRWPGYPPHTAYVAAKPWQLDALEITQMEIEA